MTAPEPIATGTLAKTPLPHLLVYLDQKKLSGTLALWPDPDPNGAEAKTQDRILLLKGIPVAGRLIEPTAALRDGLLKLFARKEAPYAFYESNLLGDDRVSGRVDPLSLIAEVLRKGGGDDGIVDQVLHRFGDKRLRLVPGSDLKRYEFAPEERALIELLQAEPADVRSLVHGSGMAERRGRRVLYLLAISKAVLPFEEAAAAAPQPLRSPAPPPPDGADGAAPAEAAAPGTGLVTDTGSHLPPIEVPASADGSLHGRLDRLQSIPPPTEGLSDELRQRWLRVVTKGRLIENQNYFEMLEIDKEAKSSDARGKFYQLAKEWHPDRLPQELQSLREYVQIIFSYMSEASAALGDENQRMKYLQSVREGGGTPATERLMQSILDTAMEYERVLVLSRRHEYDEAIEIMKRILAAVKEEPDYHAMYAWLLMQKFPGQEAPLAKMLESVNKAIELYDRHEKANMLKAQILRRMGRNDEAIGYFKRVADINPRNIDAVREVRVATMRMSNPPGGKGKPGEKGRSGKSLPPKGGKGAKGAKGKGKEKEESGVGGLIGKLFKRD